MAERDSVETERLVQTHVAQTHVKRLLREAFTELLQARTRLRALEEATGLASAFSAVGSAKAPRPQGQWSVRVSGAGASKAAVTTLCELSGETAAQQHVLSLRVRAPLELSSRSTGGFQLSRLALRTRFSRRARLLVRPSRRSATQRACST
jgi:hypothetical protein